MKVTSMCRMVSLFPHPEVMQSGIYLIPREYTQPSRLEHSQPSSAGLATVTLDPSSGRADWYACQPCFVGVGSLTSPVTKNPGRWSRGTARPYRLCLHSSQVLSVH